MILFLPRNGKSKDAYRNSTLRSLFGRHLPVLHVVEIAFSSGFRPVSFDHVKYRQVPDKKDSPVYGPYLPDFDGSPVFSGNSDSIKTMFIILVSQLNNSIWNQFPTTISKFEKSNLKIKNMKSKRFRLYHFVLMKIHFPKKMHLMEFMIWLILWEMILLSHLRNFVTVTKSIEVSTLG